MNSANDKYGSSLDRTLGAGKPVDPATRLSELLAQSLEELTRPFDPPRAGPASAAPAAARRRRGGRGRRSHGAAAHEPAAARGARNAAEEARIDADKALAELEAELFAAAKQVDRDAHDPARRRAGAHDDAGERVAEQAPPDQPAEPVGRCTRRRCRAEREAPRRPRRRRDRSASRPRRRRAAAGARRRRGARDRQGAPADAGLDGGDRDRGRLGVRLHRLPHLQGRGDDREDRRQAAGVLADPDRRDARRCRAARASSRARSPTTGC